MEDLGLVSRESPFSVGETIDRLATGAERAGLVVFARIDHSHNAAEVGADLRPTELLIFGHPTGGTPLMCDQQSAGIDLPVKALAWEDSNRRVWLTYNSAEWLAQRHGLGPESASAVSAIEEGLARLTCAATSMDGPR